MLWGCTSDVSKETGHDGVFPVARMLIRCDLYKKYNNNLLPFRKRRKFDIKMSRRKFNVIGCVGGLRY